MPSTVERAARAAKEGFSAPWPVRKAEAEAVRIRRMKREG